MSFHAAYLQIDNPPRERKAANEIVRNNLSQTEDSDTPYLMPFY